MGETFPTEVWDEDERRVSVYVEGGVNMGAIMVCSIVEIECMQGPAGDGGTFTIVYSLNTRGYGVIRPCSFMLQKYSSTYVLIILGT